MKNEIPLSALMASLQKAKGGKRLTQLRDRVMEAMSYQDTKENQPRLLSADQGVSLGTGPTAVELTGANLLIPSDVYRKQVVAQKAIWEGATPATDNVMLLARFPGKAGNFKVVLLAAAGAAAVVDNDLDTDHPSVTVTPKTGDIAATVAAINATSKILRSVVNGTPGAIAAGEVYLMGGLGDGVKFSLGSLLVQDTTVAGTIFAGSADDSYILEWHEDKVVVNIAKEDMAPGKAIPTGYTALTADEGTVLARLEWVRPLFETAYPLNAVA